MQAHSGIDLPPEDMPQIYTALLHFEDSMKKYQHWITQQNGITPLPGCETAIEQIQADLKVLRELETRVYQTCFAPKPSTGILR